MSEVVRFYFSFRSPYSWLGFYRLQKILDQLPVTVEYIPSYPQTDSSIDDPTKNKLKRMNIGHDIKRFTDAYGLNLNWPKSIDTDWQLPHIIFLYALDNHLGVEFMMKAYTARFEHGLDIGNKEILKNICKEIGLNPDKAIGAADDKYYQEHYEQFDKIKQRDNFFGVPFFVYDGEKYWGNDRIEWLVRDIYHDQGKALPDLSEDPFLRPF